MKNGGKMIAIYVLVACAVIMMIGAVMIYSRSEDNSFDRFNDAISISRADAKKCVSDYSQLKSSIDQIANDLSELKMSRTTCAEEVGTAMRNIDRINHELKNLRTDQEIMKTRQHGLDKKLLSRERTLNMNFSTPLPVDIIGSPKKGKGSLLKRSGVIDER